ncbi:NAD-dependent epimerase/dehydratase family protein [Ginsengibacter hankyongi]|uniref:NAD-dependent epimerase/dehydratase family protein n=1 Tax=Ginsengibacter hankyongi TaxID=2607284 RepID=A0A5J5ILP9_9BACT|nr:NAD-dependent epimerase/dehydratase family protein [Ginsengibacter hankyongi]KAA9039567.1 NAD-dependent epimerase/dehydratase family protein [Ginsengibacter hankyongi]
MQDETGSFENLSTTKNILVTGAAGLVGNELTKQLLDKGYSVTAIYNSTPVNISHPNLIIKQCDILDTSSLEEVMEDATHVYHCAAIVSFETKDKNKLFKINVEGTANVVNACISANVQKLIHVSSVSALGRIRNGEIVTEQMNWTEETSNSVYGKSKYLGELEVWRGIGEGLQAAIVNPTIILGGDNWDNGSSALFKSTYNEFKYYTEGTTGFVDVRDVANAMVLLMNSKISGERFILSAENLSYKEIFFLMAKYFGKKPPKKNVTPLLAEIVWRLEAMKSAVTGKKHLVTKETARTAQSTVKYDNTKILKALPAFQFIPVADTINRTCNNLKEIYHL